MHFKHRFSWILLFFCWGTVLSLLLSFHSLMPLSQHLNVLYAPMVRLSLFLYLFCMWVIPIISLIGLLLSIIHALLKKSHNAWIPIVLYIALIPIWQFTVTLVGQAV